MLADSPSFKLGSSICMCLSEWSLDFSWLLKPVNYSLRDGVVVLGAGVNPDVSQQLYYTLGKSLKYKYALNNFVLQGPFPPTVPHRLVRSSHSLSRSILPCIRFVWALDHCQISFTFIYFLLQESEQEALLSFRLLCPQPSSAFLHSRHQVLCLSGAHYSQLCISGW